MFLFLLLIFAYYKMMTMMVMTINDRLHFYDHFIVMFIVAHTCDDIVRIVLCRFVNRVCVTFSFVSFYLMFCVYIFLYHACCHTFEIIKNYVYIAIQYTEKHCTAQKNELWDGHVFFWDECNFWGTSLCCNETILQRLMLSCVAIDTP